MDRLMAFAVLLAACGGSGANTDGASGGTDDASTGAGKNTRTLVATWLGPAIERPGDQYIDMTSTSEGSAALYWYGGGYATWSVSASDDGQGDAGLTLSCTNTQCASDQPIVYSCTYDTSTLSCLGISGGRDNSYDFAASGRSAPDVYTKGE